MARKINIILPVYRPMTCSECPLLGHRPKEELESEPGTKWTYKCMWNDRIISGRGSKQPAARNRCTPRQYNIMFHRMQGFFPLSRVKIEKYHIEQQQIIFPPYGSKKESDTR